MELPFTRVVDEFVNLPDWVRPISAVAAPVAVALDAAGVLADDLAGLAVQHGKEEAEKLLGLIAAVRAAGDPEKEIKSLCKVFADGLERRGAGKQVIASRKCDLKAILSVAVELREWEPEAAGLQGAAKEARAAKRERAASGAVEVEAPTEVLDEGKRIEVLLGHLRAANTIAQELKFFGLSEALAQLIQGME
jgi:hypothetical protein